MYLGRLVQTSPRLLYPLQWVSFEDLTCSFRHDVGVNNKDVWIFGFKTIFRTWVTKVFRAIVMPRRQDVWLFGFNTIFRTDLGDEGVSGDGDAPKVVVPFQVGR
jgi:hypothetical protein